MFSGKKIIKVMYLKGSKWKEIVLRPVLEKYVLKVYVWSPTDNWKYKLLKQAQKFYSWLNLAVCTPNEVGREQLRIYFNIINAVISVEFSMWIQVAISSSLGATSYQNLSKVRTYSSSNCTQTSRSTTHQNIVNYYFFCLWRVRNTEK